jgi:hypothetical protein
MSEPPLSSLLGTGEPQCKVVAPDVSVHWYPTGARPGDRCLCGLTQMRRPSGNCDEEVTDA